MQQLNEIFCLNCDDVSHHNFDTSILRGRTIYDYYDEQPTKCLKCAFPLYKFTEVSLSKLNGAIVFNQVIAEYRQSAPNGMPSNYPNEFCRFCSSHGRNDYRMLANFCINTSDFYKFTNDRCVYCWRNTCSYTEEGRAILPHLNDTPNGDISEYFCIRCDPKAISNYKILQQLKPGDIYYYKRLNKLCLKCNEPSFHKYTELAKNIIYHNSEATSAAVNTPDSCASAAIGPTELVVLAPTSIVSTPVLAPTSSSVSTPILTTPIKQLTEQMIIEIYNTSSALSTWDDLDGMQKTDIIAYARYVHFNREQLLEKPDIHTFHSRYNWTLSNQILSQFVIMVATI